MLVQNVEKKEASALQFDAGSFCAASIVAVVEMSEYNIGFYVWELIHLKKYTQRQKIQNNWKHNERTAHH